MVRYPDSRGFTGFPGTVDLVVSVVTAEIQFYNGIVFILPPKSTNKEAIQVLSSV